jgi:O-antigen/teichoic acid export membrane protein
MKQDAADNVVFRPMVTLTVGRAVGFVAAFAIPVVLARVFAQAEFGTYKQLFLIYGTLFGLGQLGMAESLYYFVPGRPAHAGRHLCNTLLTLSVLGSLLALLLALANVDIAGWLSNGPLADYLPLLGIFVALMLASAVLEIAMISRKQYKTAAWTYAGSDLARMALFAVPAVVWGSLYSVMAGAAVFAGLRLIAMLVYLLQQFRHDLRLDLALWGRQLAYALPFALAVSIEVLQLNLHQYIVASRFDAATFAIYAVGCLQIPLVDLIATSTCNVMMVKMAEDRSDSRAALALWHDTTARLAFVLVPLAIFLAVTAHAVILTLFSNRYLASVPIFSLWSLTILPAVFAVDGVLRVHAKTRVIFALNLLRLALVAGAIGWCLSTFGLQGAVIVTLVAASMVKAAGIAAIARLFRVSVREVLPWRRLATILVQSGIAAVPAWLVIRVGAAPAFTVAAAAVAYAATYAALWYFPSQFSRTARLPRGSDNWGRALVAAAERTSEP